MLKKIINFISNDFKKRVYNERGTFAYIAIAAIVVGGALTAYGQYKQGEQQKQAMDYNAAVARRNAENLRRSGELEAYRRRRQGERLTARQSALYAKAGVLMRGSPLEVIEDTLSEIELDADIARYNIAIGAGALESKAQQSERLGKYYKQAGTIRAGSTILTTVGTAGSVYSSSGSSPQLESIGSHTGYRKY